MFYNIIMIVSIITIILYIIAYFTNKINKNLFTVAVLVWDVIMLIITVIQFII